MTRILYHSFLNTHSSNGGLVDAGRGCLPFLLPGSPCECPGGLVRLTRYSQLCSLFLDVLSNTAIGEGRNNSHLTGMTTIIEAHRPFIWIEMRGPALGIAQCNTKRTILKRLICIRNCRNRKRLVCHNPRTQ